MEPQSNNIKINESAITKPVVVLFGPRSIGKTVMLVRLCNYISQKDNYKYSSNRNFRKDEDYTLVMKSFENSVEKARKKLPPSATGNVDFILIDINDIDRGTFCQVLECPGEHFFRLDNHEDDEDQDNFEDYFMDIVEASTKKIYIFILQVSMPDHIKQDYELRISNFIEDYVSYSDEVLILYAQVDQDKSFLNSRNKKTINNKYIKHYKTNYKEIQKQLDIKKIKPNILPFSSGRFRDTKYQTGSKWYYSDDIYFERLWNNIYELISGKRRVSFWKRLFGLK